MITIGLTGSIGMGKTTVTEMFRSLGAVTWNADEAVHRLYEKNGAAVEPIRERFPDAVIDQTVDRERLSEIVLNDREALKELEAIVHPLVGADRAELLSRAAESGAKVTVLDIPLLFETNAASFFDIVVVVSAPADVQRARVLARPGMTVEKFEAILAKQTPDAEKREYADYIVDTSGALENTRAQVEEIWRKITA